MRKTTHLILCALLAALIAVGAFIKIPVPNVPVTLQTLFVLLSGMLLGGKGGAISCGVYLAVGLVGLPVFTKGGGMMYLLEPTFGYLAGFIPCAYIAGWLTERRKKRSFSGLFLAGVAGLCALYAIGTLYLFLINRLYLGTEISLWMLAVSGVLLCLPADLLCCAACAWITQKIYPLMDR